LGLLNKNIKTMDFEQIKSRPDVVERVLPCGSIILLREQNGQDEAILSNEKDSLSGLAIRKFLSRVVVGIKKPGDADYSPCTIAMVNSLKSRSVYYTLLLSRIHSLGYDMVYTKEFQGPKGKKQEIKLEADLSEYERDFTLDPSEFPKPGDASYDPHQCAPYEGTGTHVQHTLASGIQVRFKYMTHEDEFVELDSSMAVDINLKFKFRKLEWRRETDKEWKPAQTFEMFSSKDMRELRKLLNESDPEFTILANAVNPITGSLETYTLIGEPDFFFPVD
jgi:hypothetical protein